MRWSSFGLIGVINLMVNFAVFNLLWYTVLRSGISAVAFAFLQTERRRPRKGPSLTFPQARAFVQEIFTGLLFISRPQYMQWMKQAEQRFHQLRI